ncbi:CidA/LrgA family protein (plasmid) [Bradyrhizobium sp. 62B]|uniref:CidA/LrgA family protein n=1 Tax=Bradyrhizobium sp. 62B TaxID=2898442 RepID=UPI0025582621|nr:CidA/LrgA family protein [Bradyrhizobium sp. 62B]
MLASLGLILLCQLIGEAMTRGFALLLPGPIVGLLLLLILLLVRDRFAIIAPLRNGCVETASRGLLNNLSLLFVPAGVGIVDNLDLIYAHGMAIVLILALSVTVTLLATVLTFRLVSRLFGHETP